MHYFILKQSTLLSVQKNETDALQINYIFREATNPLLDWEEKLNVPWSSFVAANTSSIDLARFSFLVVEFT